MDKKKIVLSAVGLAALVIPAILLIVFTSNKEKQPSVSTSERRIDPQTVQEVVKKIPTPQPIEIPSPSPSSPSAQVELEGSPSAQ